MILHLFNFVGTIIIGLSSISPSISTEQAHPMTDYRNQSEEEWRKHLAEDVYNICRRKGTEKAGSGQYDKFYEKGTYYCGCCGGDYPLFSSDTKFDSKTGWPSFWAPLTENSIEFIEETNLLSRLLGATTEVRCKRCGSHLGHVFNDGPHPTGQRYCMNSLALVFRPLQETSESASLKEHQ